MSRDVLRFAVVWVSSLVSGVGSALSAFVLGVWVFQATGSVTRFALVMLAALLPPVLLGPVAGVVADRFDRRVVLIAADTGSALVTAVLTALTLTGGLATWHVYLAAALTTGCGTFHFATFQAITPLLVPRRHLGRANGLMQLDVAAQIAAPAMAGALLVTVGVAGVLLIDIGTFGVAVAALLVVRLPPAALGADHQRQGAAGRPPWRSDLTEGWSQLRVRPALLTLALVLTGYNFAFGLAGVLIRPLILSFASPAVLGVLLLAGGSGVLAGSLLMGAWGGPRRRMTGVSLFMALGAVALALHALGPSALLIGIAAPLFLVTLPVVQGCARTIFQTEVEPASLGRVLGTTHALGQAALPLAYLVAGPLAEQVAEPLLSPGGALAGSVGLLTGVGPGRGIAALFLLSALLLLALAVVSSTLPALREVESALADASPDTDLEPTRAT